MKIDPAKASRFVPAFIVLVVAGAISMEFLPWREEPGRTVAPALAASRLSVAVPAQANNVRYATYSQGRRYLAYLRFEAPADLCLKQAQSLMPGSKPVPVEADELATDAMPVRPKAFRDLSWWDLADAKDVVFFGQRGTGQPLIWVDRANGVFYWRKTD